jgi:hypothetical protein
MRCRVSINYKSQIKMDKPFGEVSECRIRAEYEVYDNALRLKEVREGRIKYPKIDMQVVKLIGKEI